VESSHISRALPWASCALLREGRHLLLRSLGLLCVYLSDGARVPRRQPFMQTAVRLNDSAYSLICDSTSNLSIQLIAQPPTIQMAAASSDLDNSCQDAFPLLVAFDLE